MLAKKRKNDRLLERQKSEVIRNAVEVKMRQREDMNKGRNSKFLHPCGFGSRLFTKSHIIWVDDRAAPPQKKGGVIQLGSVCGYCICGFGLGSEDEE